MKTGKKPFVPDHRDLLLARYTTDSTPLPTPSRPFGHGAAFADWGMLGNDDWGDCAEAGACHEEMLWTLLGAPKTAVFTPDSALEAYSSVEGFDVNAGPPGENPTDQGTDVRQLLKWRVSTGIEDTHGARHKLGAYVALEPGNWTQLLQATYIFGAVGMGFNFPSTAMDQFNRGQVWDVVQGAKLDGSGHYVCVVGSTAPTKRATSISWGRRQELTKLFYQRYNDETWALLSPELLNSKGVAPHGLNLVALNADLQALKS